MEAKIFVLGAEKLYADEPRIFLATNANVSGSLFVDTSHLWRGHHFLRSADASNSFDVCVVECLECHICRLMKAPGVRHLAMLDGRRCGTAGGFQGLLSCTYQGSSTTHQVVQEVHVQPWAADENRGVDGS